HLLDVLIAQPTPFRFDVALELVPVSSDVVPQRVRFRRSRIFPVVRHTDGALLYPLIGVACCRTRFTPVVLCIRPATSEIGFDIREAPFAVLGQARRLPAIAKGRIVALVVAAALYIRPRLIGPTPIALFFRWIHDFRSALASESTRNGANRTANR